MRIGGILLASVLLVLGAPADAEKLPPARSALVEGDLRVELVDLTPRFLAFYDAARDVADPAARFALWQEHYGFAAVPPGPRGEAMARMLLEQGWTRYAANLPVIRQGAAGFGRAPIETLAAVARTLGAERPLSLRLVAYVGSFEGNAFTVGGEVPSVNFPVEMSPAQRALFMPHEFAHAVHMQLAGLSGGWERSIAATLMQEGLAVHVSREVAPGHSLATYIEHESGWWEAAGARKAAILRDVRPVLAARDGDTVYRFTIGAGPAGIEREAYAAGYWVIEQLRADGMSLAEIARIPEAEMERVAGAAIDRMLAASGEG